MKRSMTLSIDRPALQRLFVRGMPPVSPCERRILAGDVTSILRPESLTARDRTYVHVSNAPKGAKPVLPGWQFATIAALPDTPGSSTTILSNTRVSSEEKPTEVVAQLLARLAPELPEDTIVTLDGEPFSLNKPETHAGTTCISENAVRPLSPSSESRGFPALIPNEIQESSGSSGKGRSCLRLNVFPVTIACDTV
ncbi:MAG: hypothetical protein HYX78_05900 [Armatimonadetes bacterium]|nr:hypothetical protein [Armatimonadota bacterium]